MPVHGAARRAGVAVAVVVACGAAAAGGGRREAGPSAGRAPIGAKAAAPRPAGAAGAVVTREEAPSSNPSRVRARALGKKHLFRTTPGATRGQLSARTVPPGAAVGVAVRRGVVMVGGSALIDPSTIGRAEAAAGAANGPTGSRSELVVTGPIVAHLVAVQIGGMPVGRMAA